MENTNGEKQVNTATENATENKVEDTKVENKSTENVSQEDQELVEKQKRLEEKQKQNKQLDEAIAIEETKARDKTNIVRDKRDLNRQDTASENGETYSETVLPDNSIIKEAFDIFQNHNQEYKIENDLDGKRYDSLRKRFNRTIPGKTVSEVLETLEMIHSDITPKIVEKTEETDTKVTIGNTSSDHSTSEDKAKALTKKLNKYEQEAAKNYPGGEEAYRKASAEKELRGGITL